VHLSRPAALTAVATLAVVAGGVGLAACSAPGPVGRTLVITPATTAPTAAVVGDTVVVELVSSAYGRDGVLVPWGHPVSDTQAVLAPTGAGGRPCPSRATCTAFTARAPGTATVSVTGPSGILCQSPPSTHCVGVAAVMRRFVVQVTAVS